MRYQRALDQEQRRIERMRVFGNVKLGGEQIVAFLPVGLRLFLMV